MTRSNHLFFSFQNQACEVQLKTGGWYGKSGVKRPGLGKLLVFDAINQKDFCGTENYTMAVQKLSSAPDILSEYNNYARSLRAIGQDLTELYPEDLEIRVTATEFLVSGVGLIQPPQERLEHGGFIKSGWNRLTGKESTSSSSDVPRGRECFSRKYTLDDINRLDEIRRPARANREGKPDIYSLGERLRTIGRIVDGCKGTLVRVVKDRNLMRFEYRDQNGHDQSEEYTNLELYKLQQRCFAERRTHTSIDPWENVS